MKRKVVCNEIGKVWRRKMAENDARREEKMNSDTQLHNNQLRNKYVIVTKYGEGDLRNYELLKIGRGRRQKTTFVSCASPLRWTWRVIMGRSALLRRSKLYIFGSYWRGLLAGSSGGSRSLWRRLAVAVTVATASVSAVARNSRR